jgi:hypothetical protein
LAYPLFDLSFVTLTRIRRGQPPWIGGRDHTTHRLATWLGGDRRALLAVYGLSILSMLAGLTARGMSPRASLGIVLFAAALFIGLGLRLSRVSVK